MITKYDKKQVEKLEKLADKVLNLEAKIETLTDEQLGKKTFEFRERIENGESLDELLSEAFAVAREASSRVLGKKHYKVQIMGGIALHQGRVAEMKTGEGKTLTELCPAYLNALTGKGVHIITVNDYLARRDKEEMESFFNFLNLSVGLVIDGSMNKKQEYWADVTYTTNTELGFDYLRDNIATSLEAKVQRGLNYVIIDEIDSVLIDEARTPLIISGQGSEPSGIYEHISKLVKSFDKDDYKIEKKEDTIYATEKGIEKVEKAFGIENLADLDHTEINHILSQTLRAEFMLKLNRDYIISDGEVVLVDINTGRVAEGRRFSDGLHQCLEAKEKMPIKAENKTLATITYQNFFKLYNKVSGMSGTVKTEEVEFKEIYSLDVVCIPTNKEIQRIDQEDKVYIDNKEKLEAIIEDIIKTHEKGNPILVGTPSIAKSEEISEILSEKGIEHRLLNAKTNSDEAEIIGEAGKKNAITVATNIAGRGTDIKISDEVNEMGGLKVIGTERSESRRIDNQLVGRAGRQGDNGMSQFYLSCDDKLLKVYGEGILKKKFEKAYKKNKSVTNNSIVKSIERAQRVINALHYEARKYTLKYDFTVNKHRDLIYSDRDLVLGEGDISQNISNMILEEVFLIVTTSFIEFYDGEIDQEITKNNIFEFEVADLLRDEKEGFYKKIIDSIQERFKEKFEFDEEAINEIRGYEFIAEIIDYITKFIISYINRLLTEGFVLNDLLLRTAMLRAVDNCWVEHLEEMDLLKKVVRDQSYNQKDPVEVYKLKSGEKFINLTNNIREAFIDNLFSSIKNVNINYDENGDVMSVEYLL
ncbi:MAG: preprotein translocase subunit SecA [Sarcina sp.]